MCRLIQDFRPRFSMVDTGRANHRKAMDAANSVIWLKCNALAVGEHPLMWHITKECKRTIKSSFVSVQPSNWDFDGNGHQPFCPDRKYTRRIIPKVKSEYYRTELSKLSDKAARNEDCTAQTSPCPFGLTRISYNPLFVGNRVLPAATSSFSIPLPAVRFAPLRDYAARRFPPGFQCASRNVPPPARARRFINIKTSHCRCRAMGGRMFVAAHRHPTEYVVRIT